jgi:signal peptidase II
MPAVQGQRTSVTGIKMRILFVTLGIIFADQMTKFLVKGISIPFFNIDIKGLPLGTSIPIFGDTLRLTYIENAGMAFGIDVGGKLFFSLFSILASVGILIYLYRMRNEHFAFRLSLAMILGGALGNLIDRVFYGVCYGEGTLFYGKVVDFIDADFFNISFLGYHLNRWPVFNIADASVTCGVLLLLLSHRKTKRIEAGIPGSVEISQGEQNPVSPGESPGP